MEFENLEKAKADLELAKKELHFYRTYPGQCADRTKAKAKNIRFMSFGYLYGEEWASPKKCWKTGKEFAVYMASILTEDD